MDFFYLFTFYQSEKDMEDLRFDPDVISHLNRQKLFRYLKKYQNNNLEKRISTLLKIYPRNH